MRKLIFILLITPFYVVSQSIDTTHLNVARDLGYCINKLKFDPNRTGINYSRNNKLYNFFYSMRQKIDDPLGKKRRKINKN